MRIKNRYVLVLILTAGLILTASLNINASTSNDLQDVLDKTVQRVLSYPELINWKASVLATMYEMDKRWEPKKKTVVEKIVLMKEKYRSESIKSAVEIKKGKSKDVTQKYVNQAYKAREKAARERKKAKNNDDTGEDTHRRMELDIEEMLPFSEKNRQKYEFALLDDVNLDGVTAYVIEARCKERTKDLLEGKFFINQETWDILRAELQLAKNPSAVKLMEMALDFYVLPEGHLVVKKMYFRIHVGLVVKNFRREATEEYFDYQILE
ncbi:hypothetical protein ACFLT2_01225 [Acidobacteriota bacterium]